MLEYQEQLNSHSGNRKYENVLGDVKIMRSHQIILGGDSAKKGKVKCFSRQCENITSKKTTSGQENFGKERSVNT